MKIAFGCDPNAARLKTSLMELCEQLGHETADFGSEDGSRQFYLLWIPDLLDDY